MAPNAAKLVHGTAIALQGHAALIRGPAGAGKSDLALRCLMQPATPLVPQTAVLIADDQVLVTPEGDRLTLTCPPTIRGLMEVRGIGLMPVPLRDSAELALIVDLVSSGEIERLPEPDEQTDLFGIAVRRIKLTPFEASAPLKLLLALQGCVSIENAAR